MATIRQSHEAKSDSDETITWDSTTSLEAASMLSRKITEQLLSAAKTVLNDVGGVPLTFTHCMGDADMAQRNAFAMQFGTKALMCFFHVLYNANIRVRGFTRTSTDPISLVPSTNSRWSISMFAAT